ncbi:hypothetical protein [Bradyrhizobium ganzhouense]|uniref:hypothetical protein n=1 Tax=Bradyrhizobium ganzhouense TaxID=1179767 RepID=UPI003CE7D455
MTCNHKIDIRTCLCEIAAALTLLTFPAAAQSLRAERDIAATKAINAGVDTFAPYGVR